MIIEKPKNIEQEADLLLAQRPKSADEVWGKKKKIKLQENHLRLSI